jgi:transposase
MVAADARTAVTFSLSPGQAHDAPKGRALLSRLGAPNRPLRLLMDRAYEGNETRQLALDLGFIPVVPPLKTRIEPWEYDREMYKRRNEVERLFRRLKGYRRIFSRFEKLDALFIGFINFVLIADGLRSVNTPYSSVPVCPRRSQLNCDVARPLCGGSNGWCGQRV